MILFFFSPNSTVCEQTVLAVPMGRCQHVAGCLQQLPGQSYTVHHCVPYRTTFPSSYAGTDGADAHSEIKRKWKGTTCRQCPLDRHTSTNLKPASVGRPVERVPKNGCTMGMGRGRGRG